MTSTDYSALVKLRQRLPKSGSVEIDAQVLRTLLTAALGEQDAFQRGRLEQLEECRIALRKALGNDGSWSAGIIGVELAVRRNVTLSERIRSLEDDAVGSTPVTRREGEVDG